MEKPPPGAGRPRPKQAKPKLPKARCLYAYDAQDTDELSFNEGDTIEILKEGKTGFAFICVSTIFSLINTTSSEFSSNIRF